MMPNTDRDRKEHVKHVQELLCLAGYHVVIDGVLGPATQEALRRYQRSHLYLTVTGRDDDATMVALTKPLREAIAIKLPVAISSYSEVVNYCANIHLREHPREVGGQNRGPWVRLYMDGVEGQPWCAGFVSYIIKQAAELLKVEPPIKGSVSCAELAAQALAADLDFIGTTGPIPAGSIMLVRGGPHGHNHTGIVTASSAETFETIEGNTNDLGSPEGFEVCKRIRSYTGKDFIVWKNIDLP
jgi:hypothetical protein